METPLVMYLPFGDGDSIEGRTGTCYRRYGLLLEVHHLARTFKQLNIVAFNSRGLVPNP